MRGSEFPVFLAKRANSGTVSDNLLDPHGFVASAAGNQYCPAQVQRSPPVNPGKRDRRHQKGNEWKAQLLAVTEFRLIATDV